jgi:hypothetical protein
MVGSITKRAVDALAPGVLLWDRELPRFGVKVTGTGTKVYVLQYPYTLGRHGAPWTPDLARREALRLLALVASGVDPATGRRPKALTAIQQQGSWRLGHSGHRGFRTSNGGSIASRGDKGRGPPVEVLNQEGPMPQPARVKLTPEAARYIKASTTFLEKARCPGNGPPFVRIGSRKVGYLVKDLDKWLESRRRTSTSDTQVQAAGSPCMTSGGPQ